MTETNPRNVEPYAFDRALQLTRAAGDLIDKASAANMPDVQTSVNTLVVDMVVYAKELLATPKPADPEAITE